LSYIEEVILLGIKVRKPVLDMVPDMPTKENVIATPEDREVDTLVTLTENVP
jgi:hypothetical protein